MTMTINATTVEDDKKIQQRWQQKEQHYMSTMMITNQTTQWRQIKQHHRPTMRDAKSLDHDNDDRWRGEGTVDMKMKLITSCCSCQ